MVEFTRTEAWNAATTMYNRAGGFLQKLAEAWFAADPTNQERIERAFNLEFEKYIEVSDYLERKEIACSSANGK